jgi:hypothetical protein
MDLEWSVEARATMATDGDRNQCKILRMAQVSTSICLASSCDEMCDRGIRYLKGNSRVVAMRGTQQNKLVGWQETKGRVTVKVTVKVTEIDFKTQIFWRRST